MGSKEIMATDAVNLWAFSFAVQQILLFAWLFITFLDLCSFVDTNRFLLSSCFRLCVLALSLCQRCNGYMALFETPIFENSLTANRYLVRYDS
jgi:hypothetical protein